MLIKFINLFISLSIQLFMFNAIFTCILLLHYVTSILLTNHFMFYQVLTSVALWVSFHKIIFSLIVVLLLICYYLKGGVTNMSQISMHEVNILIVQYIMIIFLFLGLCIFASNE